MYATGIGLVLYGFHELDEQRRHHQDSSDGDEQQPEVTETPEPATSNDVFADLPIDNSPKTEPDDIETEDEKKHEEPKKENKKAKPNFGSQLMKSIDKYFGRVFGDETIRNEGKDEHDL